MSRFDSGYNCTSIIRKCVSISMSNKSLSSIFSELSKLDDDTFPPVEDWNPPICENVSMRIDRSGKWYFMNSPIGRQRMVNLFSRVLRLDEEGYFLVTPVEKIQIEVEDKPFVIVDFEIAFKNEKQIITFKTNTDEIFEVNENHPLRVERKTINNEPSPYVLVRRNLEALLSRNVFYKLVDISEEIEGVYGVFSSGKFYQLQ